jgi:hypothetical protein
MNLRCPSQIVALLVFKVKETAIVLTDKFGYNEMGLLLLYLFSSFHDLIECVEY